MRTIEEFEKVDILVGIVGTNKLILFYGLTYQYEFKQFLLFSGLNHYLLVIEMFLLCILSRFAYRRQEAKNIQEYSMDGVTSSIKDSSDKEVNGIDNFVDVATVSQIPVPSQFIDGLRLTDTGQDMIHFGIYEMTKIKVISVSTRNNHAMLTLIKICILFRCK